MILPESKLQSVGQSISLKKIYLIKSVIYQPFK